MRFLRRFIKIFSSTPDGNIDQRSLHGIQAAINYRFGDPDLLVRALVHRSYSCDTDTMTATSSNERLEFLGDAVLSLVVNQFLYQKYTRKREGELTKMKSVIVSKPILSRYARRKNLGSFVLLSENAQRGKVAETDSVLANTLEAIFGAVFLDGGYPAARDCIRRVLLSDLNDIFYDEDNINYKSLLQEYIQALHKVPPRYRVSSTTGPEHDKEFAVEVGVRGNVLAKGVGKTKKLAEQEAARAAYKKLLNTEGIAREQEAER
jgi:ribonuclease-3